MINWLEYNGNFKLCESRIQKSERIENNRTTKKNKTIIKVNKLFFFFLYFKWEKNIWMRTKGQMGKHNSDLLFFVNNKFRSNFDLWMCVRVWEREKERKITIRSQFTKQKNDNWFTNFFKYLLFKLQNLPFESIMSH